MMRLDEIKALKVGDEVGYCHVRSGRVWGEVFSTVAKINKGGVFLADGMRFTLRGHKYGSHGYSSISLWDANALRSTLDQQEREAEHYRQIDSLDDIVCEAKRRRTIDAELKAKLLAAVQAIEPWTG